jgi:hypothetical protein
VLGFPRHMSRCRINIPGSATSAGCHLLPRSPCRYGTQGLRIFRLLLIKGQLEQKQIADLSMLPVKDTRELLYNMMQVGAGLCWVRVCGVGAWVGL